ncbi:hypothetical protein [Deinococcus sp.]|uniref:hypothetical protein n=1 Tax=Deinococcus sp. TaxID=47478 RepID=UPI003CC628D3
MKDGLISEEIILTTDEREQTVFSDWARRTGVDVDSLVNTGCGCCVDIYTVQASAEQLAELRTRLAAVLAEP